MLPPAPHGSLPFRPLSHPFQTLFLRLLNTDPLVPLLPLLSNSLFFYFPRLSVLCTASSDFKCVLASVSFCTSNLLFFPSHFFPLVKPDPSSARPTFFLETYQKWPFWSRPKFFFLAVFVFTPRWRVSLPFVDRCLHFLGESPLPRGTRFFLNSVDVSRCPSRMRQACLLRCDSRPLAPLSLYGNCSLFWVGLRVFRVS